MLVLREKEEKKKTTISKTMWLSVRMHNFGFRKGINKIYSDYWSQIKATIISKYLINFYHISVYNIIASK